MNPSMSLYIFGIVTSLAIVALILVMLRKRSLREKHAVGWFVAATLVFLVGVFPDALTFVARFIGFGVPSNLLFFVAIIILLFIALQASSEITKLQEQTRTLAEVTAALELKIRVLNSRLAEVDPQVNDDALQMRASEGDKS